METKSDKNNNNGDEEYPKGNINKTRHYKHVDNRSKFNLNY